MSLVALDRSLEKETLRFRAIVLERSERERCKVTRLLVANGVEVVGEAKDPFEASDLVGQTGANVIFMRQPSAREEGQAAANLMRSLAVRAVLLLVPDDDSERLALHVQHSVTVCSRTQSSGRMIDILPAKAPNLPDKLPVRTAYSVKLIAVEEIDSAFCKDKRVFVKTRRVEIRTQYTLSQLELKLPSADFMRIHSSVIVRLERIEEINFLGNHSYSVRLTGGCVFPAARSTFAELQQRLNIGHIAPPTREAD